jgi:ABC-2 type transport system permease protein
MYFLFDRFHRINGFSFAEVLLCYAVVFLAFSTAECFVRGFDVFPRLIRSGDLDRILVRPKSIIFQVLTSNVEFTRVGRFLQAVLVLAYALPASGVVWSWDKVLTLALMLIGGFVVFSSLFVLYAGISFFTIEGLEFMNIFTDGGRQFGSYPLSVYGDTVLKFFTYVIPLALFQYYPFLYLVGRSENRLLILLPLLGFVFFLPCYSLFRFGLRKYQSTGS